jgi:hypothetical protein
MEPQVAIEGDGDSTREPGSFRQCKTGFQTSNESQGKTFFDSFEFSIVQAAGAVSRVKMNAKQRRP